MEVLIIMGSGFIFLVLIAIISVIFSHEKMYNQEQKQVYQRQIQNLKSLPLCERTALIDNLERQHYIYSNSLSEQQRYKRILNVLKNKHKNENKSIWLILYAIGILVILIEVIFLYLMVMIGIGYTNVPFTFNSSKNQTVRTTCQHKAKQVYSLSEVSFKQCGKVVTSAPTPAKRGE